MSAEIYLALAEECYEAPVILMAFTDKERADSFVQSLRDYERTRPEWPHSDDPDEVFEQAVKEADAWRKAHPGGEDAASRQSFSVLPVPLAGGEA